MTNEEAFAIAKAAVAAKQWLWIEPVFAMLVDREDGGKSWWISNNDPDNWVEHAIGSGHEIEIDDASGEILFIGTGVR
jgi:hypothetical protein